MGSNRTTTPAVLCQPRASLGPSLRFDNPAVDPLERRWRLALLLAMRRLRFSVLAGRPLSLPNVIRVFRRHWATALREYALPPPETVHAWAARARVELRAIY